MQWGHLRNPPPMQSLSLLGGAQDTDKGQEARVVTWETPIKCQETFLHQGGRGCQTLEWGPREVVNVHPWRYLETSPKSLLWLAQL